MIEIDPESKRYRRAIRFFTYGLMTMATIVLTSLVILLAMGYRFDRNQFGVIREGLLQLGSHPVDVHYKINGKDYKNLTPDKQTLPAGSYNLEMAQTGYRTWQKQVDIIAGHIHWVNYPRLIPQNLQTNTLKDYESVSFNKVSPDKRWMVLDPGGRDRDKLEVVETKDPKQLAYTTITMPESQLTKKDGKIGQLEFSEWALDSKFFLVRHVNGDIVEYLRVDRTKPQEAVNLNQKFQLKIDKVHFSGGDVNIVFGATEGALRRFDIGGNTTSAAIMNSVDQFEVFGDDTIVFNRIVDAKSNSNGQKVREAGMRLKDKDIILQETSPNDELIVNYGEFDHHTYFVVANRSKQTTSIFQDIADQTKRSKTFAEFSGLAPQFVRFNSNSRFLLLQQGAQFGIYDFYEQKKYGYTIKGLNETQPVRWLDDFHPAGVVGNKLKVWDFDGTNQQTLVESQAELEPLLDEDDDILYTISKAQDGSSTSRPYNLTSTSMKVQ